MFGGSGHIFVNTTDENSNEKSQDPLGAFLGGGCTFSLFMCEFSKDTPVSSHRQMLG